MADIEARGGRALLVGGTGSVRAGGGRRPRHPRPVPRRPRRRSRPSPTRPRSTTGCVALDPTAAGRMEPGNRRRIVRALEVTLGSGRPFSSFGPGVERPPADAVPAGRPARARPRTWPARIEARYDAQMAAGFLDEVRRPARPPRGHLPHRGAGPRLQGAASPTSTASRRWTTPLDLAVRRTRRFARRQRAWFRRDPRIALARRRAADGNLLVDAARRALVG